MATLLELTQKFDSLYRPEFRDRLRSAIETSSELSTEDHAVIDAVLVLGDEIKSALGERHQELDERFDFLITNFPSAENPILALTVNMGLVPADAVKEHCLCPLACIKHEHARLACVGCPRPIECARHCFGKMGADGKMLEQEQAADGPQLPAQITWERLMALRGL